MGLFERIREAQMRARRDGERGAAGNHSQARIAAAREMMTQTARATAAAGVDANATVTTAAQTGALFDMEPVIEIGLTVIPDGDRPPYPATITQPVRALLLERLQVGSNLAVKVDPDDPASIWIDFSRTGSE